LGIQENKKHVNSLNRAPVPSG